MKQNLRFWKKGKVLPLLEKVALSAQVPIKIKESTMQDCTIILAKTENSLPVNGRFPEAFKFPMLFADKFLLGGIYSRTIGYAFVQIT